MHAAVIPVFGHDGIGTVDVTHLDIKIRRDWLESIPAHIWRGAQNVAGIGLLYREYSQRTPFRSVGRKKPGSSESLQHKCEFLGQVVRVLHAGVTAKASVGGHNVGGIACDEDSTILELLGHVRA